MHLESSVPGKAQCHCQQCYIAILLKEITIDLTALLPMLFAGDSQGFPCQLGSQTARLFLHQMARPTPSGCRTPPGDEALTSICLAFYARRTVGSEITRTTTLQLKSLHIENISKSQSLSMEPMKQGKFFSSLTFTAHSTETAECLLSQKDAVANKIVPTLKEVTVSQGVGRVTKSFIVQARTLLRT